MQLSLAFDGSRRNYSVNIPEERDIQGVQIPETGSSATPKGRVTSPSSLLIRATTECARSSTETEVAMLFDHTVPAHSQMDPIPSLGIDGSLPKNLQLQTAVDRYRELYDIDAAFGIDHINIDTDL